MCETFASAPSYLVKAVIKCREDLDKSASYKDRASNHKKLEVAKAELIDAIIDDIK